MRTTFTLLAAFALLLAACGDGSADDAGNDVPTTGATDSDDDVDDTVEADGDDSPAPGDDSPVPDEADEEPADHEDMAADGSGDAAAEGRIVEVAMTDFAFDPAEISVAAGETVTFDLRNDGAAVHEFRLSNAHRIEEHMNAGHEDHGDEGGHHGEADVYMELEAGESGRLTVTFPEDETFFTEAACLLPGHYEAGMKAPLTYQ